MSDAELVERLRERGGRIPTAAALRIEALTAEIAAHKGNADANYSKWAEDDAKLAKLVSIAKRVTSFEDTTEELAECDCARCKAHLDLRALLAEIEGEKT